MIALAAVGGIEASTRAGPAVRGVSVVVAMASAGLLASLPGIALLSVVDRRSRIGPTTALACLFVGSGVAALAAFWVWSISPDLGTACSIGILALSAAVASVAEPQLLGRQGLRLPIALAFLLGLVFLSLGFLGGGIMTGPQGYDQLSGTPADNVLPFLFAQHIAAHVSTHADLIPGWLPGDRPPAQTAFVLMQYRFMGNQLFGYQLLATALQMAWLPALWVLLAARRFRRRSLLIASLATAFSPFVAANVVFVWPKMIAGAYILVALALLLEGESARWSGVLSGACVGLGMLCHGGVIFSVVALVPIALHRGRIGWRGLVLGGVVAGVLYAPWLAYQHFLSPPGDRVIKWNLAGVVAIDRRSTLQTLVDQYRSLPVLDILRNKWHNVANLFYASGWALRLQQVQILAVSLGPLLAGVYAIRRPFRDRMCGAGVLIAFVAISLTVWAIAMWGGLSSQSSTYLSLSPYSATVLSIGLCALGVTTFAPIAQVVIFGAEALWFASCWWGQAGANDWEMGLVGAVALLSAIGLVVVAAKQPRGRPLAARTS